MTGLYFEDEFVQLYHGDCREFTSWTEADVLVTDPPYGVQWSQKFGSYGASRSMAVTSKQAAKRNVVAGDKDTVARDDVLALWREHEKGVDRPGIMFGSWRMPRPESTVHRLIWHKAGRFAGMANTSFFSNDEEIYILGKGFVNSSPPQMSVITTKELRAQHVAQVGHPTPKPIGLMELLIARCPAGVVADPFAGSGATLMAARNIGRKAIGVELEEKYCELTAMRLGQQSFDFDL